MRFEAKLGVLAPGEFKIVKDALIDVLGLYPDPRLKGNIRAGSYAERSADQFFLTTWRSFHVKVGTQPVDNLDNELGRMTCVFKSLPRNRLLYFMRIWFIAAWLLATFHATATRAEDWPQWRYDSHRSAATPEELPLNLHHAWTREYSPRVQVWDDPLNHDLMTFDRVFEPIVLGNLMVLGFNDRDKVVALDIKDGREVWSFYTEGPVRLAPAAWDGKVYFASDDGYLYCVTAREGTLVWKYRGAPSGRKALGNSRLVSAWPARGGPVIRDGKVFFAASIWPFMGTFIHALDARTGAVVWVNDGTGALYIKQPHAAPAFGGVAPQGSLVATRDTLLVPGGRSVPAAFDLDTGRFLYFQLEDGGKGNGGSFVAATDTDFFVHTRHRGTRIYDLKSGKKGTFTMNEPVLAAEGYYSGQPSSFLQTAVIEAEQKLITARQGAKDAQREVASAEEEGSSSAYKKATNNLATALKKIAPAEQTLVKAQAALSNQWTGYVVQAVGRDKKMRWEVKADASGDLIKAGRRLYAAGTNSIIAIEIPAADHEPRVVWSTAVQGSVQRLLAANGRLFAVTLDGRIHAFSSEQRRQPIRLVEQRGNVRAPYMTVRAREIISQTGVKNGLALWLGIDNGQLLEAVLAESDLQIAAVDSNAKLVEQLRRKFDAAGMYGSRVTLHVGNPTEFSAPPYMASIVVVGDSVASQMAEPRVLKSTFESVRPYGGSLWIAQNRMSAPAMTRHIQALQLPNARVAPGREGVRVVREGALPGSADWTHQYGDAANTVKSDDRLVKLPLGVLWFGGNSNMDVLPRHGHGPTEQIAGGRLFIQGMNLISARDVYTGRVLWRTEFEDLGSYGVYYDSSYTNTPLSTAYNQKHIPGANARGANYVSTPEAVYVLVSNTCHVLDARDGRRVRIIDLPRRPGEAVAPEWGFIGIEGDVLLAGAGFAHYTARLGLATRSNAAPGIVDLSASRGLVGLNRHTGRMLWRVEAKHSFIHNGIVAGNGKVYCLDKLPKSTEDKLKRRGRSAPNDYRIAAYDLHTGKPLWEANTNILGTWLGYSKRHDALLQAGAAATDRLKDEATHGMVVYHGTSGNILWEAPDLKYTGPCVIHNDLIITTPTAYKSSVGGFGLLDGKPRKIINPVTGLEEPLRIFRTYGCNHPIACENLVTFRSGAAGYYDLENHSGTGNFGGFKSGCTANLIAANGVLNAPDYTRTCSCAYQNQTSLALVHMPDLEIWTHNQFSAELKQEQRAQRVGVNFGAPGDRLADSGTLWIDYPSVGGSSPHISVKVSGSQTNFYRRHASQFAGVGPSWVLASGVANAEAIVIRPAVGRAPSTPPAAKKKSEDDDDDDDDDDDGSSSAATNATVSVTTNAPLDVTTNTTTNETTNAVAKTTSSRSARWGRGSRTNRTEVVTPIALTPAEYTVRLYFAEPDRTMPGERQFAVDLQGRRVIENIDILATSGSRQGLIKEFKNVIVTNDLTIHLTRSPSSRLGPVLSGIEMILEEVRGELQDTAAGQ